jgi:hypothetical protein
MVVGRACRLPANKMATFNLFGKAAMFRLTVKRFPVVVSRLFHL